MWELDLVCTRYRQTPSQRLRLVERGFSEVTAYSFDKAVARLARLIETKVNETTWKQVPEMPRPSNGHVWQQVPRYTMAQLLKDGPPDTLDDVRAPLDVPDDLAHLPAALL